MAEHSRFFDSIDPLDPDKVYTAEDFVKYLGGVVTGGIVKGEGSNLKVETSGSNMNVTVDTGMAYLVDRQYENDSKLSLTHEVEALGKSRIDRVVLRLVLDMDARYIKAFVKKGVAGVAPVVPPLTRTADVYEISLAQVKVIGGQTYINVADVTDERGNPDVCPWAGSKILPNFDDATLESLVLAVENMKIEWIQPPLSGSITNTGYPLKYGKDNNGMVRILGSVRDTTGGTATVFTLPVGYRPSEIIRFRATKDGSSVDTMAIYTHGAVMYYTPSPGQTWIDVSFRIDE